MRICFIDNSLWSLLHFRGRVIKALRDLGHDITIIAPYEEINSRLEIKNVEKRYISLDRTSSSIKKELRNICEIKNLINSLKPDWVITYTLKPTFYTGLIGLFNQKFKCASMLAGLGQLFMGKGLKFGIIRSLIKPILNRVDNLILLNEEDYRTLVPLYCQPQKCVILEGGEGLDVCKYHPINTIDNRGG